MNEETRLAPTQENSFEKAFGRLETILEKMNSGTITLDESLKLYEEADTLINSCNKWLNDAERKIEMLIKNRSGDLALSSDQKPMTQEFKPSANSKPRTSFNE